VSEQHKNLTPPLHRSRTCFHKMGGMKTEAWLCRARPRHRTRRPLFPTLHHLSVHCHLAKNFGLQTTCNQSQQTVCPTTPNIGSRSPTLPLWTSLAKTIVESGKLLLPESSTVKITTHLTMGYSSATRFFFPFLPLFFVVSLSVLSPLKADSSHV